MQRKISIIQAAPFTNGCNTAIEPALLDGMPSLVQNFRKRHPGYEKRKGCIKKHSTADSTNKVMSMYQFVKGRKTERHFYAQMSDSDVLEATDAPPAVTTGAFGSEVFSGTASPVPASWANVNDLLLFANGVDEAQVYPGTTSPVERFIVYKGDAAIPTIPEIGYDYTLEVTDGDATTVAVLDSLGDLAVDFDCIFVMTPVPITGLTFTIAKANGTASTTGANYWNGSAWTGVDSFADATASGGKAFAVDGAMTWTLPTAHKPSYMFSRVGFWYQIYLASGDLDSETEVSAVTYDSSWQDMACMWDGTAVPIVESQLYSASKLSYEVYGNSAIDIGGCASGDYLYVAAADPICGIYIDVGSDAPATGQSITAVSYWNGAWTSVTGVYDGTSGLVNTGWITFGQQTDVQKQRFNSSQYEAYWYRITIPQVSAAVMLNFNGADGATTFTDESGKTWTAAGNAQLDTAAKKFGTASLKLDGTGDYITTANHSDFDVGTGDFTIEWQMASHTVASNYYGIFGTYTDSDNYFGVTVSFDGTDLAYVRVFGELAGVDTFDCAFTAAAGITADEWVHIALVRKDGVMQLFQDGVALTKLATGNGDVYYKSGLPYDIGRGAYNDVLYYFNGWIDDFRFTPCALYAFDTNFTPPAAEQSIAVNGTFPTDMSVSIDTQPYFSIADFGKAMTVCAWKNRLSLSTTTDHYMYLSAENQPQVLYGDDCAILAPGDGRNNRPVAQRKLHDDLLVWQEEKGQDGGCLTKFTWKTSVDDIEQVLLSNTIGCMNAKSVDVVDGVSFSDIDDTNPIMNLAFFLSRSGVYVTNGSAVYRISDAIKNYFDPTSSACIRTGYAAEHWLCYDSAYNVVRIGLVSGSSATVPNVFPVYDVQDKTWSFDSLAQEFSCMCEAEAGSGAVTVVQLGGGVDDGTVYVSNSSNSDVSSAIDAYTMEEIDGKGEILHINEFILRAKAQSAGSITVTPYLNSIAGTAMTLEQTAATTNETIRRHRKRVNLIGQHISLKIQHATAGQSCYLLDMGAAMESYEER